MVTIQVDNQSIEAEAGEMLIAATDRAGIYIPRFCYHEKLSIVANCRMCLIEVENSPKPLPACATPVTDGMIVSTRSKFAREAQQGTLEFLLINHPLDCPVCDQGGECPLQDQAVGYGSDQSRFLERKRVVASHDIGPLISTEMTRCIHCTRCTRFGEEVAGVMELGLPGRGEAVHIATFLNRSVDSEVSGNMIDLCPVGALTSKPYRFAARSWELQNHRGISPHDCVGTNINIQTLRDRVERVLPNTNPKINDCWLADRDRYSYEAVNSPQRLTSPMIKKNGKWKKVSWELALKNACNGIKSASLSSGNDLGALAGYTATLEEYFLLQKLMRALGCNNIDHRLQQQDFRDDEAAPIFPGSELAIEQFDHLGAALLVGSNIRKEQPLLALRLNTATRKSANGCPSFSSINPLAYRQNFAMANNVAVGADMAANLASVAAEIARHRRIELPTDIQHWVDPAQQVAPSIAQNLLEAGDQGAVIIGALAQQHEEASVLKGISGWICAQTGNRLSILPPGNSAAAWLAGCLPHRGSGGTAIEEAGQHTSAMLENPRRAYLLLATDPDLDSIHGRVATEAMQSAEFVVQITSYKSATMMACADVLLPMAAFAESAGTFVNCEGIAQYAEVAASPQGESRPAWKILRVLGNFLDLPGFDYVSLDQVSEEIDLSLPAISVRLDGWKIPAPHPRKATEKLHRLLDMPMYRGDQTVRYASSLQKTADNPPPAVHMNGAMLDRLGLTDGQPVLVQSDASDAALLVQADERIPLNSVYIPAGYPQTGELGGQTQVTVTAR